MLDAAGGSSSVSSSTSTSITAQAQVNTNRVDDAVNKIRGLTGDDGFLGTSRNDHMHDVADTLGGLSPAERNAVVSKLSDGDLKGLAEDFNAGGVFGHVCRHRCMIAAAAEVLSGRRARSIATRADGARSSRRRPYGG